MKLWLKQTLITLAVILLSVSLCLYYFVAKETDGLIQQAFQNGERDTAVFCDHLSTLDRTSTASYDTDGIARQSLIQYTFSTYAHLLQTCHNVFVYKPAIHHSHHFKRLRISYAASVNHLALYAKQSGYASGGTSASMHKCLGTFYLRKTLKQTVECIWLLHNLSSYFYYVYIHELNV